MTLAGRGGNTFAGGQNELKGPDIASAATTMGIWAAAQGNSMTVTGTAATSGLPAAPQAGASRELIAAGAWPLTHGANFILPGSANYTCTAGDIIDVTALTTTQFRLKITKADGTPVVAAAVSVGNHCVSVHTGNGHGSTSTKIRRFTTALTSVGTAITYADSSTLGGTFTINEDGIYAVKYRDTKAAGACYFGISLNSAELTTSIDAITIASMVAFASTPSAGLPGEINAVVKLSAGDVVRAHTNAQTDASTAATSQFIIRKVGT
jgi:hypothetical protein